MITTNLLPGRNPENSQPEYMYIIRPDACRECMLLPAMGTFKIT